MNYERKYRVHRKGKSPKQGLTIMFPEDRDFHFHRLDLIN